LPERLEGRLARRTRLLQPGRADGADEERRLDVRAADRALGAAGLEALLDRLDLELALAHLVEILGWTEEHVDERAEERREEPEQRREGDDPRAVDPPPRVLERPVADREPEDGADRDQRRPRDRPCTRREEVGEEENRQDGRHYKSSLPIMYPAKKASPTKT